MLYMEYLRKMRGMSQRELGESAGVDPSYISRAERHGFAYPAQLERIAAALGHEGETSDLVKEVVVHVADR